MKEPGEVRAAIRRGEWTRPTAGLAPGYTQANLVALPEADAFDFLRFCVANPKPCPVLDVSDPGSPEPARIAPDPITRQVGATASSSTRSEEHTSTPVT